MNTIGIDTKMAESLAKRLNELLANYQIFYTNVRGFHWNIRGEKFFELHVKFEELYNDLILKIDEIAERIPTLGFTPECRYSRYFHEAGILEAAQTSDGIKDPHAVVEGLYCLIKIQRVLLNLSDEAKDEGTNSLMSDYIREQEKLLWMYSAFLNKSD